MKNLLIFILLLSGSAFSQNADWVELQGKIDTAIKYGHPVRIERNYTIDKPLVAALWNGTDYRFFTFRMEGYASMWDIGQTSVIRATFKDAPILSIHKSKGSIIKGVNFQGAYKAPKQFTDMDSYGDTTCRDSRYSPYAAIAIDPFRFNLPPDGGYPTLTEYYRGSQSRGGSTGIRIEDCWFSNVTIGAIVSPSGWVQNAEMITFENIQLGNCKYGIVGCQAQEKMNRVINIGTMAVVHTVFGFNRYGQGQPGQWIIDGVNLGGRIHQLVFRGSNAFFPLRISNVFAESIDRIGYWQTQLNDALVNADIDFQHPNKGNPLPPSHLDGGGVSIQNSVVRYYGYKLPVLISGQLKGDGNTFSDTLNIAAYKIPVGVKIIAWQQLIDPIENSYTMNGTAAVGSLIVFSDYRNGYHKGMGQVVSSTDSTFTIGHISDNIKPGIYRVGIK